MVLAKKMQNWWKCGHKKLKKIEKRWSFDYPGILFLKIEFSVQFPPNFLDFRVNFVIFFIFWKNFTFYLPKSGKNASFVNERYGVAGSTNSRILGIFRPVPFQWKIITHPIINRFQRFFAWELYLNISFKKKYFKLPHVRARGARARTLAIQSAHSEYLDHLLADFKDFLHGNYIWIYLSKKYISSCRACARAHFSYRKRA